MVIGVVVLAGVLVATLLTLFIVPVGYSLLARRTGSPGDMRRRLDRELGQDAGGEELSEREVAVPVEPMPML